MKRVLFILCSIPLLLFSPVSFANAQETSDFSKLNPEDYTNISLPPLDLLFENAKGGPIYELASVKEQIERKLLAKERRAVLSFFNIRGSYQWGKFGNDYTFTDVSTPILYNYSTSKQQTYTVGAAVNIPLDELFDLAPRVRRQKLNVKTAALEREAKFEDMKKEIIGALRNSDIPIKCFDITCGSFRISYCSIQYCRKRFCKWNNRIKHFICRKRKTINSFRSF